ncbi:MAG: hypothetical protein ACKVZ0_19035 [Gemmatimonadales bacterium]
MALLDPTKGGAAGALWRYLLGNPLTMVAWLTAMRLYSAAEVTRLNALGERLRGEADAVLGRGGRVPGVRSRGRQARALGWS